MPPTTTRSKPSTSARMKPKLDSETPILDALADASKCDDELARRLASALNITERVATAKPMKKGKQKAVHAGNNPAERRRLAMRAANAASQSLGNVVQSGWKGLDPHATPGFSKDGVLSIVSSFRMATSLLRELMPGAIEVERVASGFINKLIAVQLYELALELSDEVKLNVVQIYHGPSSESAPRKPLAHKATKLPSISRYLHLMQYPLPAPADPILLGLIGAALGHALTAVTALVSRPPTSDNILEAFAGAIEEPNNLLSWHPFLPADLADTLMARAHRVLATTFSSSNTPTAVLLRLRTWALRGLLCKVTLDPDSFWTQATNYMASHGKSVIKSEDAAKAVADTVAFFDGLVAIAQERRDAAVFMSGSAFFKFCQVALVFAQRGDNVSSVSRIVLFINGVDSKRGTPCGLDEFQAVKLYATFSQGVAALEKFLEFGAENDVVDTLAQCTEDLSACVPLFSSPDVTSNAVNSLERLRRMCGKVLEETKDGDELRSAVKLILVTIVTVIDNVRRQQTQHSLKTATGLTACAVDSLCILAKVDLSPADPTTHITSYSHLQRAVTFIDPYPVSSSSNGKCTPDSSVPLAKALRCISGAFWNHAVVLYQDDRHAPAVRFLVQACELGARACDMAKVAGLDDAETGLDPKNEMWKTLKAHLTKRWELLGDCYSRIGDRRLAYGAFLESLKIQSFESLCHSAASLSPSQIFSDPTYRRLATLIERITYIAVSDLLMKNDASLRHALCTAGVEPEAIGLVLEWQEAGLEGSLWKDEARSALACFLRDALDMYGVEFPVRRVRVLLRQLELAYRTDDLSVSANDIAAEIHDLLSVPQNTGKDAALANLQTQYHAVTHMWLAFHAHRCSENNSHTAVILEHATLASKILRGLYPPTSIPLSIKSTKYSPKVTITKASQMATRTSPRKKAIAPKVNPVTPKPRKMAMRTPPKAVRQAISSKPLPVESHGSTADSRLTTTIQMLAQLMGLLGHVFLKIQFLNILQRMTERSMGPSADDFVRASVDAAIEYGSLGKTQRALTIYAHALGAVNSATSATISDEVRVTLLLHYAETLALNGNTEKSSCLYEEARNLAQRLESQQPRSTAARIRARVLVLERSALASKVFSVIQVSQDDPHAALSTLRQSLRLWNRAFDSVSRLSLMPVSVTPNPFDMASLADTLPSSTAGTSQEIPLQKKLYRRNTAMDGLQWRIAEGLLHTLFGLGRAYFLQGSVRGAEYFIEQARDLAESLNTPAMLSRALTKKGELLLHQGNLEAATANLLEAAELLRDLPGVDAADVNRLRAHHSQLIDQDKEAKTLYLEAVSMLSELEKTLATIEHGVPSPRKSLTHSPGRSNHPDVLVPGFLAMILKQQIWLQRNEPRVKTKALLDQLVTLPPSRETKAEELAILAKLALHDAHVQFRADLFLSSIAESTIAVPMGLSSQDVTCLSPGARHMLETLSTAEKMFWANLEFVSNRGQAPHVREAAVSLALIRSFQTSLGKGCTNGARLTAGLLDASAAITLRRELVDAIEQKFPELDADDMVWPAAPGRSPMPPPTLQSTRTVDSDDVDEREHSSLDLKKYWQSVRDRYYSAYDLDQSVSTSQVDLLPVNWTVVSVSITEDKGTMFFSRQRPNKEPLIFCVPLERHGRKEEDTEEQFTYDDVMLQFKEILEESNVSARYAKDVPSGDRDAKAAWWANRVSLDKRMRELLENIEFCWLGAFKTILSEPVKMPAEILNSLRAQFDKIFKRNLASDQKRKSRMQLDDTLVECFASLSPKCRDEELEDLVYFVLDLYQFHGVHVALSEIDMDQVTVELRTALEEHASRGKDRIVPEDDAHLFLVLDKNVQGLPWESIPTLRGRSVSRIPSLSFLVDRIEFAKLQRQSAGQRIADGLPLDRAVVNPKNAFYVLNPSGDLTKSEARFGAWTKEMEAPAVGWQGIVGRVPSEQELLDAFAKKDLVIYVGHGGAEQYVRSTKIKHLPRCAATMLWGCSSGLMRDMGDFDRVGTPYTYMLAGCPTLVACLWDVTDNELDKVSRSVFEKLRLDAAHVKSWSRELMDEAPVSLVSAVCQSRDVCKLKYLTGAAPVVYGIPFYL